MRKQGKVWTCLINCFVDCIAICAVDIAGPFDTSCEYNPSQCSSNNWVKSQTLQGEIVSSRFWDEVVAYCYISWWQCTVFLWSSSVTVRPAVTYKAHNTRMSEKNNSIMWTFPSKCFWHFNNIVFLAPIRVECFINNLWTYIKVQTSWENISLLSRHETEGHKLCPRVYGLCWLMSYNICLSVSLLKGHTDVT